MGSTLVLCTCHGTIEDPRDIPAFLSNIRHGRPTPPEIAREVERRFEKIGGSPLMRITGEQARALQDRLGVPVAVAARLWKPYPREVLAPLVVEGVRRVISLPLAPQSVHVYHANVEEAAKGLDVEIVKVPSYGLEPALIDAFVEVIDEALARFEASTRSRVAVLLTAHSLPRRIIDAGDPYERDFRAMAAAVLERVRARGNQVEIAFQSQGMTADPWLGPDLPATFAKVVREGATEALIAPIGFVADHVETLYDLDVEAPAIAKQAGLARLERAAALNARRRFIDALEAVARRALG